VEGHADLPHQLEEDQDLIEYKAKKHPALYPAFFPSGRSEYKAKKHLAHGRAAEPPTPPLAPGAARYATFRDAFVAARAGTGASDEQSAQARAKAAGHRQALTQRLTDAVNLVAAQHLHDEACAACFRPELLQALVAALTAAPAPA